MLTEILKIKPQLDASELSKMVRSLNSRFADVAKRFGQGLYNVTKKFGGGLKSALTGGGIVGALGVLADRFLNPLQETTETLNRVLSQGDDLSTFANQFETTSGRLLKLQALAGSSGLDPETLRMLLTKFQVALAEQRQLEKDPTKTKEEKKGPLQQFVGIKDTAEAFFQFIQALQKADKDTQVLIQSEVFGEKLIGKQSEFLQTDFNKRLRELNLPETQVLTNSIEGIAAVEEIDAINRSRRQVEDIQNKGRIVNSGMVSAVDRAERQTMAQEDKRLNQFEAMEAAAIATTDIKNRMEDLYTMLIRQLPLLVSGLDMVSNGIRYLTETVKGWNLGEQAKNIVENIRKLKFWGK